MGKKNIFISSISLCLTALLLIVSVMAWYVTNHEASVSGVIGTTQGVKGTFALYYWNEEDSDWDSVVDNIKVGDTFPNDVVYFKLVSTSLTAGATISANLSGISSTIDDNTIKGDYIDSKYIIKYNGIPMYKSTTTSIVETVGDTEKTIYTIAKVGDNYTVSLADYKIQNAFGLYTAPTITDDAPVDKGSTKAASLTSDIFRFTVESGVTTATNYFALSFDSKGDEDNYFMYQGLYIDTLIISS